MPDAFDLLVDEDETTTEELPENTGDAFDVLEKNEEPLWKSALRTLYQIPSGIAQAVTWPADLIQLMGSGEALDPEEIERIRQISEREGVPFDEEKYLKATGQALETFPTQSNIERGIESKTGLPLEPKTRLQKFIKFASTAGKLSPKDASLRGLPEKPISRPLVGLGVATTSEGLKEAGVPEPIADLLSFLMIKKIGDAPLDIKSVQDLESRALEYIGDVPTEYPPTAYKAAEEALSYLKGEEKKVFEDTLKKFNLEPLSENTKSSMGLKSTAPLTANSGLDQRVGNIVSRNEIFNKRQTGSALKDAVMSADKEAYKNVRDLYTKSKELNSQIDTIHPKLVEDLLNRKEELRSIPEPSSVQKKMLKTVNKMLSKTAKMDNKGNIEGYLPMNSQTLIEQAKSLRQSVDYDFSHGRPKNSILPLINEIENAVEEAAQATGNKAAYQSLLDAKKAHSEWKTTFDNKYVRPYRNQKNLEYRKMYEKSLDGDYFNILKGIVEKSNNGPRLLNSIQREIVQKELKDILKNPSKFTESQINKRLRELDSILPQDQVDAVRKEISDTRRISQQPNAKDLRASQKYTDKTPSEVESLMNSRDGIRELREDLSKTETSRNIFDRLSQQKLREILRKGRIKKNPTGKELFDVLDDTRNYNLVEELTSPQEARELLEISQKLGDKEVRRENLVKFGKSVLKYKTIKVLLSVI